MTHENVGILGIVGRDFGADFLLEIFFTCPYWLCYGRNYFSQTISLMIFTLGQTEEIRHGISTFMQFGYLIKYLLSYGFLRD